MDISLRAVLRTLSTLWFCGLVAAQPGLAALPELTQPNWSQLTTQQQQTLAPLTAEWDSIEPYRRKTWLGIAARYEKMSPDEKERIQERMRSWAKLAPEERRAAREKYKVLKKVDPEQRESLRQNWEDYKALPDTEKKRLKDSAIRRPPTSLMPPPKAPGQRKLLPERSADKPSAIRSPGP